MIIIMHLRHELRIIVAQMEVRGVNGNKWRLRHEIIIITKPRTPSLSLLTATTTPQVIGVRPERGRSHARTMIIFISHYYYCYYCYY